MLANTEAELAFQVLKFQSHTPYRLWVEVEYVVRAAVELPGRAHHREWPLELGLSRPRDTDGNISISVRDVAEGDVTYRHINIAVEPRVPSRR